MLAYNGLTLDRAPSRRADPDWIAAQRAHPTTRVIGFWQDKLLPDAHPQPDADAVFLGLDGDTAVFATDLPSPTGQPHDLRALVSTLDPAEAATLAYARGILHWQRNQRFCGACGGATDPRDGGHHRQCRNCGKLLFPRIEPAIIVLVTWQDHCLLARHRGANGYSTLAGFVEVGENLETAVHREVREEAGVRLADVRYQASQAWPFPAGLMIGYRAHAASPDINVDHTELDDARWFTATEVRALRDAEHHSDSIERFLVDGWLTEQS
ncbi:NAD(+) diphosphatase [Kibdelosporangium aridum]|uniref:NAD(+) diphosphatase n=1 Tax=Kibdelosporangium aridum TaxID=2030 RepID=A0A1W2BC57_KIBAR|nr:NAD(+) diphosphatase [Kibdelosporangium aridum]SMC70489.1 NAD+ diphosphatase [Kibdelosporangium aridum]